MDLYSIVLKIIGQYTSITLSVNSKYFTLSQGRIYQEKYVFSANF